MSNEFGYIPESPKQSFGNNKGIFTPTDIYDLTRADKFTQYGQLELLQSPVIRRQGSTSVVDWILYCRHLPGYQFFSVQSFLVLLT